jgi:geranylgeranyl reductase family protein
MKPCGGALSEQAMSYLDFSVEPRLVHAEIFGARVHFGKDVVSARKPFRIAVLTQRIELDEFFLRKAIEAGVEVAQRTRVTKVEHGSEMVEVQTQSHSYSCRYIIGADGAQSVIARFVRPRLPKSQYALTFEFDLVSGSDVSPPQYTNGLIDIYFGSEYMGYSWVFPKRDYWNIGLGALASDARNVKASTYSFSNQLDDFPIDRHKPPANPVGWIVPAGGYRRRIGIDRILLVGDAAGFVDPFYGEGIAYAILSGKLAGGLLARALRDAMSPIDVQRTYAAICYREIVSNLRYGLLFAKVLHAWPRGLLRLFSTDQTLLEAYLDVPAARRTYREYVKWFVPRAAAGLCRMALRS